MINLLVRKEEDLQNFFLKYLFYDDINRIPLEIVFDETSKHRESITIDNYDEKNGSFITFSFDKDKKSLDNITFISINEANIIYKEFKGNINTTEGYYRFYIDKFDVRSDYETMVIVDYSNSVLFSFNDIELNELTFYSADDNLSLGIDSKNHLRGILFKDLEENNLKQFLNL